MWLSHFIPFIFIYTIWIEFVKTAVEWKVNGLPILNSEEIQICNKSSNKHIFIFEEKTSARNQKLIPLRLFLWIWSRDPKGLTGQVEVLLFDD